MQIECCGQLIFNVGGRSEGRARIRERGKLAMNEARAVLLTGFGGFIGPHVADFLLAQGLSVVAVVRRPTPENYRVAQLKGIKLLVGDLSDEGFLHGIEFEPASIVHLAANTGRRGESLDELRKDNVLSTALLHQFSRSRGCGNFIYVSSVSVHGRVNVSPLNRMTASRSPSPYGKTKLLAEQYLQASSSGASIVALRLPGILGPNAPQHLISSLVEKALAGDEISLHHSASLFNNVVHVSDLSRFIAKLAITERDSGFDAFPLASRDPIPMRDVFDMIKLMTGSDSRVREIPSSEPNFFIDDSHARSVFGYTSMNTRDAIAHFVDPSSAPIRTLR